ncbi:MULTISPECIES: VOC family protein [unclassified Pseudonocardia]|jgi:catechol 2,3-dioxygenase-like lactoylglutathione lyase family enzyme|uniref:VOC family protein n=1 Tax=unclassified Pseudonocardia TaxID=2619320 RepID=UPI000961E7A4|nr:MULTISPECIES: VOC family protein [unclassified Pseudonocardia]MBN9100699.1 VOC family protein [Pseudonocardia sp.]OJY47731.1 MAG: glyoxalase [Pseudonocardia sp. 73-21]
MITHISIATVFVKDVEESKAFYVDVLGFAEHTDITLGEGYRWCTVKHPSQPELQVHLAQPGPPLSPDMVGAMQRALDGGGLNGLGMNVDDCRTTYDDLAAKGVQFIQEPQERPYGIEAVARDNSGNWMVLVEPKEFTL